MAANKKNGAALKATPFLLEMLNPKAQPTKKKARSYAVTS